MRSRLDQAQSNFAEAFTDEVILVVGAGGSIGSALAGALAREGPRLLVLLDCSEQGLFEIERTLEGTARCEFILGNVCDCRLLQDVFNQYRPQMVFHAAAFKHVGLLERSPLAAIANNVLGTHTLLEAAMRFAAGRFVLVSTDKAVKPHSVMGVSKRLAELITLSLSTPECRASAIRLGNVIGSSGSVVPIFREQIARGGPVLVTDAEAFRYFVTMDEAVEAILAAGAAGCDGKVLLPDLGEPVRVAELAQHLIDAHDGSGQTALRFTGLKSGEKLREELVGDEEVRVGSAEGSLTILESQRLSRGECAELVEKLSRLLRQRDWRGALQVIRRGVPEYIPSSLVRQSAGDD